MRGIRRKASAGDSGWYGCANTGVKVDTTEKTLKLTEGDTLTIKCFSNQEIKFYSDLHRPEKASKSEEMATAIGGGEFTHSLEKKNVVPEDSGRYGCKGDKLSITCNSYEEMAFYTVLNNPNEHSMMTESESAVFEGAHTRTLEKKSVIPGDSGRYGCAYANVAVDTSRSDQPDVNWITVNVN
ncbi:hypothetical protein G9C98_006166 [Cotesia typhae]|uniref:Uncharacterized protein n=1 Tax=Cotesia typhae TaxID=2053667 RepID=A0A8J5R0M2_9HYME|nr:hypothetical protein G9C98_006166 [Cotesia typhae]